VKPISTIIIIFVLFLSACGQKPQAGAVQHYHLTGKVISLNPKEQTVTVAAAAIPNFMEAMTMDYPVKSKSDFGVLRVGASIEGTVNVADAGGYDLSEIKVQSSGK
jgi:Cu/Ag efflux protein CusF